MSQQAGRGGRSRSRSVIPLVVLAVVVALVSVAGAIWWRPALYATGLWTTGGASTVSPSFFDDPSASPSSSASSAVPAGQGEALVGPAPAATAGTDPTPAALAKALGAVSTKDMGTTTGIVLDASTGKTLWQRGARSGLTPASTMKLLTCLAALDAIGPDTRFTTRVVSPAKGRIVLVGGGDPYLASTPAKTYPYAPASATLAAATAKALRAQGTTSVTLGFDDSLFTGPAWQPSWPDGYHDQVTTPSALWIDKGSPNPKAAPSRTPAATAATVFAAQLKATGITVTGTPAAARAGAKDAPLASISSLPVRTLVSQTLLHSDNSAAEVLLRQVGLATGNGGSFAGGTKGVQQRLTALGDWQKGARMVDGSGLSRSNVIPATMLAGALHDAATTPRLAALLEGLPVAGVTGTLGSRFYTPQAQAGRGWVNAKTGTLSKVSTLAGYTRTRSGGEVVFAFMANNPTQEWGVRNWLDQMSSTVASCGC